ncbi:uncharacterized protein [Drosophila kikkawai]|uniref:Transmembrane protein 230 n=1 Tax=Drosophila kikkawai TaxID=30033 RepID=A0ABM3C5Z4_DROKI|nr:uncharacterized protein LOC108081811 [Drosophila kikkawai]KAH8304271.1 hypothetical protein KR059_005343 [Drosophila kikkawai]
MAFVQQFLGCIELNYAVYIIGIFDMILSLLCGCYLPWIRRKAELDFYLATPYTESGSSWWTTPEEFYHSRFGYAMWIFLVLVLVLHIGACILIIVSSFTKENWMVAPYLATALVRFVVLFLILLWMVAKCHDSKTCYWLLGFSLFPATYFYLTAVSWYAANDTDDS